MTAPQSSLPRRDEPPASVGEVVDLVTAYAKQETLGPLKGAGKWLAMGAIGAALMAEVAFGKPGRDRWLTRWWMRLTALLGFAGVGFHAFGVSRNMGGWRNWSQNLLNGPPLPAPPSFTGMALAGLAAMGLLEDHPDA